MAKRGRPKKVTEKKAKKVTAVSKVEPVLPVKEELNEAAILKAFELLGIAQKLDKPQLALFIEMARLYHLNPLKREIHAVQMGGKLVPVTGYEVYIQRARETGLLRSWRIEEEGEGKDYKAILVIQRRDWPTEFRWVARYSEVKRQGPMWTERPTFMTQKVAISQGFRLCFGEELGGMPYTIEEMTDGRHAAPERNEPKRLSETKEVPVAKSGGEVFDLGSEVQPTGVDNVPVGGSDNGVHGNEPGTEGADHPASLFAAIIKKLNASTLDPTVKIEKMKQARENKENASALKEILNGF